MNQFFTFVFVVVLMSLGCSKAVSGEVNLNGQAEVGTISLKSAGFGAIKSVAIGYAEKNAFKMLLFKGIPGSQQNLPMIADEQAARSAHTQFFDQFFEHAGYRRFVLSSEPSGFRPTTNRKTENLTVALKINVESLRRELENEGLIRKFGY